MKLLYGSQALARLEYACGFCLSRIARNTIYVRHTLSDDSGFVYDWIICVECADLYAAVLGFVSSFAGHGHDEYLVVENYLDWARENPGDLRTQSFRSRREAALMNERITVNPGTPQLATQITNDIRAISIWVDDGNSALSPDALVWCRLAKVAEEFGEVVEAHNGATGQNPRKGATHTRAHVIDELLDVAVAALGAVEHLTGNHGQCIDLLGVRAAYVAKRARESQ
jgi:hypothetical protein